MSAGTSDQFNEISLTSLLPSADGVKMTVRSLWSTWSMLLLLSSVLPLRATEISCRNEDGKPVDW